MDSSDIFYFISTRSYNQTLSTIYSGVCFNDSIMNIQLVSGISKETAGWINFDAEVSKDGETLFFATALYDANGGPYESNLDYAVKTSNTFQKTDHSILIILIQKPWNMERVFHQICFNCSPMVSL